MISRQAQALQAINREIAVLRVIWTINRVNFIKTETYKLNRDFESLK